MSFVQSVAARPMFAKAHSGLATSNRTVSHICMGRSKVMQAEVEVRPGEPFDMAMKRFRRKVTVANVINEVRRRQTFENPQDVKKRKEKERRRRNKNRGFTPTLDDAAPLAQAPPFADMFGFDGATMLMPRGGAGAAPAKTQQAVVVPSSEVGKILGFRGATQQAMEARTGAHIFIQNIDGADTDRIVVEGDDESVRKGMELVQAVLEKGPAALDLPTGRRQPRGSQAVEA